MPPPRPVTTPVLLTVASDGLPELQVPPVAVSARVMVAPTHTVVGPVMVPAVEELLMVMVYAAVSAEQGLFLMYNTRTVPAALAVTAPAVVTVANAVLVTAQVPPVVVSV